LRVTDRITDRLGGPLIEKHLKVPLSTPRKKFLEQVGQALGMRFGDQTDTFYPDMLYSGHPV
jgi:hypothetical protein